ncbi:MAG: zinc ribbon domain-containing protein [Elusimicrobia bacterium]|nr:zinc ribbon domain-containing protein [Elusimicrobiota bacterium]
MKCTSCGVENKDAAKACKKCGFDFTIQPAWFPDAMWHLKTLGVIYVSLAIFYYGVTAILRKMPKPYQLRHIPIEMTPWLVKGGKVHLPEDQLKAPPPPPPPSQPPAWK